jgi:hypothetical protein
MQYQMVLMQLVMIVVRHRQSVQQLFVDLLASCLGEVQHPRCPSDE